MTGLKCRSHNLSWAKRACYGVLQHDGIPTASQEGSSQFLAGSHLRQGPAGTTDFKGSSRPCYSILLLTWALLTRALLTTIHFASACKEKRENLLQSSLQVLEGDIIDIVVGSSAADETQIFCARFLAAASARPVDDVWNTAGQAQSHVSACLKCTVLDAAILGQGQ